MALATTGNATYNHFGSHKTLRTFAFAFQTCHNLSGSFAEYVAYSMSLHIKMVPQMALLTTLASDQAGIIEVTPTRAKPFTRGKQTLALSTTYMVQCGLRTLLKN